ncbi:MAG TPA: flagellar basal body-associated FliL family protein [Verrucomicrobiae bacterium]|nr:flagellar basal body-associated FliL family protein [Verrucomicrobiae bacterium]
MKTRLSKLQGLLAWPLAASLIALPFAACGKKEKEAEGGAEGANVAKAAAGEGGGESAAKSGSLLNLEPFVVNLADPGGGRYVKCTFKLEVSDKPSLDAIQAEEAGIPKVRDRILALLSSRTAESLMTSQGKDLLKREVQARVNPLLRMGKIQEVYITEFLVQ